MKKEKQATEYLEKRFGAEIDKTCLEFKESSGDVWLVSQHTEDISEDFQIQNEGLRAVRFMKIGLKPTTYALQLLEDQIKKNLVKVNREELEKLLKREKMMPRELEKEGYVAIEFEGSVIGCGMYKENVVSSRIPKGRSEELVKALSN